MVRGMKNIETNDDELVKDGLVKGSLDDCEVLQNYAAESPDKRKWWDEDEQFWNTIEHSGIFEHATDITKYVAQDFFF